MKRIFLVLMCCSIFFSQIAFAADVSENNSAESTQKVSNSVNVLMQLGLLDSSDENVTVTKKMVADGLDAILNVNAETRYFDNQDMEQPIFYGQLIMTLIDITGYTPYMDVYGYNTTDENNYLRLAERIDMISYVSKQFKSDVSLGEYADLMYKVLTDFPVLQIKSTEGSQINYYTNKNDTLLTKYMELEKLDGVIEGVDYVSLDGNSSKQKNYIQIGGRWYSHDIKLDMFEYLGKKAEVYVSQEEQTLKCIVIKENDNRIISIMPDDINADLTQKDSIAYYDLNNKLRYAKISKEVDVVYNREIVPAFDESEFKRKNTFYTLIDNDRDGQYDVVIAEQYKSFIIYAIMRDDKCILDTYGTVHDFEDFYDDGNFICDKNKREVELRIPLRYDVISYLEGPSGKMTYAEHTSNNVSGVFDTSREGMKYITIDGKEYECTADYLNDISNRELVSVCDKVTAFLDCKGFVFDIKLVSKSAGTAYLIKVSPENSGEVKFKILDEDGEIKFLDVAGSVLFNGVKISSTSICTNPIFTDDNGEFKRQLIQYKLDSKGNIKSIDTAEETEPGSVANDGFTLDYNYEKSGSIRAFSLNGNTVMASRYLATINTTVFCVYTNELNKSYVQPAATSMGGIPIATNDLLDIKIYDVDKNYEARYVVFEREKSTGGWVDYWGDPLILNNISMVLDAEGETRYRLECYDIYGNKQFYNAASGDLTTNEWNTLSPDGERFSKVKLKDMPRGTVFFKSLQDDMINSIAIQHMPMEDYSEVIFENITGSNGIEYLLSKNQYNGEYLMSYGQVLDRVQSGIIINNHLPTEDEIDEGKTYPIKEWNRLVPLLQSDTVFIYEKSSNLLTVSTADSILPGDYVFLKRSATNYNGVYVYRE